MMTPMWISLFKVLLPLLLAVAMYEAKDYDAVIKSLFITQNITNDKGVVLFNRTEAEMQSDQPSPPRHHSNSFVFPDSPLVNQHTSQAPPHAQNDTKDQNPCSKGNMHKHKTFCTEVDDYPDISSLTQKLKTNFSKFFGNDFQPTDVGSRFGDADERFLCRSIRRTIQPKKGIKADNTWEFIINTDEYKQSIQIEECEGENQACDFAANFPQNYNPVCKQHYTQQTLASLKSDGKLDVVLQAFMIPSCCKCALKAV
ncbi:protein spaetzle isoform X7 [Drosophila yakuba]|uniref:Spz, isoform G n=1 Tax=Drosophila yakuba TaxID=7245 RepID=A0A0R1E561_DROYA|nr:protein spaetzle isoform X7 [Drosophila yakuba]KRK04344.1 spz, isoform G [Drosophila yakuba]